jgi:hypothetical protein
MEWETIQMESILRTFKKEVSIHQHKNRMQVSSLVSKQIMKTS